MTNPISRLPAKGIQQLIQELSDLQARVRAGDSLELPIVTRCLSSGESLVGRVLRLDTTAAASTLLLQSHDRPMDVHYVLLAAVHAVTIHYTDALLPLLSDGKIRPTGGRIPSRLDLERQARSVFSMPYAIAWDELPQSELAYQSLELILQDIQAVLTKIQGDELGRSALQAQVNQLTIGLAAQPEVQLRANSLAIGLKVEDQDLIALSRNELQQAIERLL
jgi:hypothetical protein